MAILVACHLPESQFDETDPLGELRALAETAGATVVGELIQNRRKPNASTYLGKGKIEELNIIKDELNASIIIFDNDLSPSQVRNIEEELGCKIIDRSELILDIFAGRATTAGAKIQVELAQLEYTYPRLRAMWTHFGQIAGGAPVGIGTRGPGETQIETDRRLVQRRKSQLKKRIVEIQKRRVREVANRRKDHFTVCLVGYTNAGKSTIFNALTEPYGGGGAYADDRVFATLTTRTRHWPLGRGDKVMLSDTVGFVRDLPHHLVASFRATLEEAIHADLQLIVVDVSDPLAHMHYKVVCETLDTLNLDRGDLDDKLKGGSARWDDDSQACTAKNGQCDTEQVNPKRLILLNKVDQLQDHTELAYWNRIDRNAIVISAVKLTGLDSLSTLVHHAYHGDISTFDVTLPLTDGRALSFAENRGTVLDRTYTTDSVTLRVELGVLHASQLKAMGASIAEIAESNLDNKV